MKRILSYAAAAALLVGGVTPAQARTVYVQTPRWSFSYSNDGLEGIVLRNVWYTSADGVQAKVADFVALEFFRVRYQDDAAGPYSDNFQLSSKKLYIECPSSYDQEPYNMCSVSEGGCEADPTAPGCTDSSAWTPPPGGVGVCEQRSASGAVRLTAQGGYNCGMYRFVEEFEARDDGTLALKLSAKGIQATSADGTSREHMHYAYFRLDVDADTQANQITVDGARQINEAALDFGGLQVERADGYTSPVVFSFSRPDLKRSVWVWSPDSDLRDHPAYHGDATWVDWARYDAWLHLYHAEELVGKKSRDLYGPPYGQCGGDEWANYEGDPDPLGLNREGVLNEMAATTLVSTSAGTTQIDGAERIDGADGVLWVDTPLYHDADPTSTQHGCHDVEVRLRPSWSGCYPNAGQPCPTGTWQCDGTCR